MLFSSLFVGVLSICVCALIFFCVCVCLFPPFTLIAFTRICVRACRCVCGCVCVCVGVTFAGEYFCVGSRPRTWPGSTQLDSTGLACLCLCLCHRLSFCFIFRPVFIFTHILCPYFSHSLLFCCLVIYLLYFASKNCFSFATGKRSATVELKPWATRARKINFSNA